jgi:hypothetical protein
MNKSAATSTEDKFNYYLSNYSYRRRFFWIGKITFPKDNLNCSKDSNNSTIRKQGNKSIVGNRRRVFWIKRTN